MENSFNNILFLTSFCCMVIDGDIAKEELKQLQSFAEEDKLFGEINVEEEFSKCLNVLKQIGTNFVKSYLEAIEQINFSDNEKYQILEVAVKTIYADEKIEYNEIKFFKSLCNHLNLSKESIIENVANVEEYWLEDDLASNTANFDFLHDVNFSQIESNLSAAN
ncbi:tellurite resistance TerB family protein [Bacteroides pyogenes]|uniref:tellurite resistance TerB family protein n=1 Tax=Bacteroides pyogenes TaxID=310300 RepID=UPI001F17C2A0|nr:TerB family tellurite resistance protein [Bacteroides pyogenes]MCE9105957.1 TerB family tellurite resistance protein [Bacteroides pyogenes]